MLWLLLTACESVPTSGHLFEPVAVAPRSEAASVVGAADPRVAPAERPFRISSEEMASGGVVTENDDVAAAAAPGELGEVDAAIATAPGAPAAAAAPVGALASMPALSQFPVRLVSTLPQAQPPRAVLGLPDGSEVVVAPGSVLGPQGLVVLAVMDGRVQLARVHAAGDHAQIDNIELTAQYR